MNKKEIIIIAVAIVVVAAGVGIYYWSGNRTENNSGTVPTEGIGSSAGIPSSTTMQALPSGGANIVVPEQNASSVPAGVAAPMIVASGSPSGSTSYRSFDISVSGSAFSPNTMIVNKGDTVHINLTAVGGNYDFTQPDMGLSLSVSKGRTKVVQFDANMVGKLTFYCASCGGPAKGPMGYIEVVGE
jgi:heme/copper-type cytochrome/quinol oxidase subunit 2